MRIEERRYELNGHELIVRSAAEEDAEMLLDYLRITCAETRYLLKEPEENAFTLEEEKAFLRGKENDERSLLLIALLDGEHVGNASFMGMEPQRCRHRAGVGIALYRKYTGMGIGRRMMERLCEAAKACGIEQLELEVVTENERALSLYKSMGFEICGTLPRNMKYRDGSYADMYWMMKRL